MRRDREIVVFNNQVAHGSGRHVQPQRLPVVAVVKGDINGALGAGEEQTAPLRIFAHHVDVFARPECRCTISVQVLPASCVR